MPIVTMFGGSGFIGRYAARKLAKRGWRVRVAVRRPNEAHFLRPYGDVGQIEPFQHGNDTYLLEAKWHRAKTDATTLHGFQGKVNERPEWTRGLFVSFSGFTEGGLQAFTARKIILADGMDIYDALARRLSVPDIIAAKVRHASEYRNPFERARNLFPL